MTEADIFLLSVQSPHVERILAGTKKVEFRRRPLKLPPGSIVLLYAAGARRELVGSFVSGRVDCGRPAVLWGRHRAAAGLTREEYHRYFSGADVGYAVPAATVRSLPVPIPLHELRRRWPRFSTPQTHRRVSVEELDCILNGERSLLLAA